VRLLRHYLTPQVRRDLARPEAFQVSAVGRKDYVTPDGIRVCPALTLLRTLI